MGSRAQRKVKESAEALELAQIRRERDFINELSRNEATLRGDLQTLAYLITEGCARILDVERVGLWLFDESETVLRCFDQFNLSSGAHSTGEIIHENEFKAEFDALKTALFVDASDPFRDPRTAGYVDKYLKEYRITSMLDVVIRFGGKNLGDICFEHVDRPHQWRQHEIDFGYMVGAQLSILLERRALRRAEEARLQAQEHLRMAQELDRAKSAFISTVSHELRTPLTLISGPVEKMLHSNSVPSQHRQDLEMVLRNSRKLLKLVNDLLDAARLEAGKMSPHFAETDLADQVRFITSAFDGVAQERDITYCVEAPATLQAQLDPEMFERILLNLLSNAFKFTPKGGKVLCSLRVKDGNAELRVQDNGPGIPPSMREAIFERFRQIDVGAERISAGVGLGLSIAKEYTELHSGTIEETDAPGGGALFIVTLPLRAPAGARVRPKTAGLDIYTPSYSRVLELEALRSALRPSEKPAPGAKGAKGRILVVEDNPDLNQFVCRTLSSEYEVEPALDGREGLEKARRLRPDLIISDIMMPVMTGDEMFFRIHNEPALSGIPIVFLTAKAEEAVRIRLLRRGAQDYLEKPFSGEELLARVGNLVTIKRSKELLQKELKSRQTNLEELAGEVASHRHQLQKALGAVRKSKDEMEKLLRVRDDFISIASHEFKTPVTALKLQLQILRRLVKEEMDARPPLETNKMGSLMKLLAISEGQLEQFSHMIENLLDMSYLGAGKVSLRIEDVDLSSVVAEVVERNRTKALEAGSEVKLSIDAPVVGQWDRFRIEEVVTNLVGNAIKYGAGKPIEISTHIEGPNAKLIVRDYGIGIAKEDQNKIFDKFERAASMKSFGGFGLGLFISRQIVSALGGSIQVDSELAKGSKFTVKLPLRRGARPMS